MLALLVILKKNHKCLKLRDDEVLSYPKVLMLSLRNLFLDNLPPSFDVHLTITVAK
jgi:hypothetical protein